MSVNRRTFLRSGSAAATALAILPSRLRAQFGARPEPIASIQDPRLEDLTARALDAARAAGAVYADVRLSVTRVRRFLIDRVDDGEAMGVGVRVWVDGYWGFASGPVWTPDEMARLGREAAHQAKVNATGDSRDMPLAPATVVRGHWTMPVSEDPFMISPYEIQDHLASLQLWIGRVLNLEVPANNLEARAQDKVFASTLGSYCTQRQYLTTGNLVCGLKRLPNGQAPEFVLDCLSSAGLGFELYTADHLPRVRDASLRDEVRRQFEETKEDYSLPIKPVNVGRYDTAFDAMTMTHLLDQTIGRATELDRALGFEANAGGTSSLSDPRGMLGHYQVGASLLTVTGNRSDPGGASTVKWDDERVEPDAMTLVKDGVLSDFQTLRETAGWLNARSHGCAYAPT